MMNGGSRIRRAGPSPFFTADFSGPSLRQQGKLQRETAHKPCSSGHYLQTKRCAHGKRHRDGPLDDLQLHPSRQDVQHVIQISVDGLHAEQLQTLLLAQPERFGNFQRFIMEGVTTFNARSDVFSTYTLPNHTTMITGRPVLQPADDPTEHHGYTRNGTPPLTETLHDAGNPAVPYIASTFDVAHDHGLSTALYSGKSKFSIFPQSYNVTAQTAGGRPDQYLDDGDQGNDKIDNWVVPAADGNSTELIARFISDMQVEAYDYAFLHFLEPDESGHAAGWSSPRWDDAVALVDELLGGVFELVETDPQLAGNTALVLTADHGGLGLWHDDIHDPNIYTVPLFVWGPGVAAQADLYRLNRLTRRDPGTEQPAYTADVPPIRNGDTANLALGLLGLPPVEGSRINAQQDLLVDFPAEAVWDGDDPQRGDAGDGTTWADARNWSRDGHVDTAHVIGDAVRFPPQTVLQRVQLAETRAVQSLHIQGHYDFPEGEFHVVTGKVDLDPAARATLAGLFSPRGITLDGGGTLQVNGSLSNLLLIQGTLTGDAVVQGNADILDRAAPGHDLGTLRVQQNLTLGGNGRLLLEVDRAEQVLRHDQVVVDGLLNLRGGLEILPLAGYEDPAVAGQFDRLQLVTMGRRVGTFRSLDYGGERVTFEYQTTAEHRSHEGQGLFRSLQYENQSIWWVNYRAVPGDANGDGRFATSDLVAVFAAGGYEDGDNDNADWTAGDWNGDQDFDSGDLVAAFRTGRFEAGSVFDPAAAAQLIPEPKSALLLACGVLLAMISLRRNAQLRGEILAADSPSR